MKASKIIDMLIDCISETIDVVKEAVVPQASFEDDLGADSLDRAELAMALEELFNIKLDDEDITNIVTVNDAIKFLITHIPCEVDIPLSFSSQTAEKSEGNDPEKEETAFDAEEVLDREDLEVLLDDDGNEDEEESAFTEDANDELADLFAESAAEQSEAKTTHNEDDGRLPTLSRIAERVADIIAPIVHCKRTHVDPISSFRNHYDIDSAQALEIKTSIEAKFDIEISDNDILHIQRVGDLMECVAWKLDANIDVHFQRFGPPTPWHKAWEKEARRFDEIEEDLKIRLPQSYVGAVWTIGKYIKADKGGRVRLFLDPQETILVNKDGRRNKDWDDRVFAFACERASEDNVFVINIKSRNSAVMRMAQGDADTAEEAAPDLRTWIIQHIPEAKLDLPRQGSSAGCAGVLAALLLIILLSALAL
ncbi:phosphopantetheine-binding protein [Planctomycetota bacterium]